jgi:hypothetical protein
VLQRIRLSEWLRHNTPECSDLGPDLGLNMTNDELKTAIREAGGIVHSDGNIFFTNSAQFLKAAAASVIGPMKFHPSASHINPDYRDWWNATCEKRLAEYQLDPVRASQQSQ